jgi:hypothetical protein
MKTVVVYSSKYGSTKGIAEFIADKRRQQNAGGRTRSRPGPQPRRLRCLRHWKCRLYDPLVKGGGRSL